MSEAIKGWKILLFKTLASKSMVKSEYHGFPRTRVVGMGAEVRILGGV